MSNVKTPSRVWIRRTNGQEIPVNQKDIVYRGIRDGDNVWELSFTLNKGESLYCEAMPLKTKIDYKVNT